MFFQADYENWLIINTLEKTILENLSRLEKKEEPGKIKQFIDNLIQGNEIECSNQPTEFLLISTIFRSPETLNKTIQMGLRNKIISQLRNLLEDYGRTLVESELSSAPTPFFLYSGKTAR